MPTVETKELNMVEVLAIYPSQPLFTAVAESVGNGAPVPPPPIFNPVTALCEWNSVTSYSDGPTGSIWSQTITVSGAFFDPVTWLPIKYRLKNIQFKFDGDSVAAMKVRVIYGHIEAVDPIIDGFVDVEPGENVEVAFPSGQIGLFFIIAPFADGTETTPWENSVTMTYEPTIIFNVITPDEPEPTVNKNDPVPTMGTPGLISAAFVCEE